MTEAEVRLVLIRHGETDFNACNRFQGLVDRPLTSVGVRQAEAVGRSLDPRRWAAVCSSRLIRAEQTADLIARPGGIPRHSFTELAERDLGRLDGMDRGEFARRFPTQMRRLLVDPSYTPPNGETTEDAIARFCGGLVRIAATVEAEPGQVVLVVAHGGVLAILARYLMGQLPTETRPIGHCHAFSVRLATVGAMLAGRIQHWDVAPRTCEGPWDEQPADARLLPTHPALDPTTTQKKGSRS